MENHHSFLTFIKNTYFNDLYEVLERHIGENWHNMGLRTKRLGNISSVEIEDAQIYLVHVTDSTDMDIQFDVVVVVQLYLKKCNNHKDDYDDIEKWFRISCNGKLDNGLKDFQILNVELYYKQKFADDGLSDELVPYISQSQLEKKAENLLKQFYPEALNPQCFNSPPICVEPLILAQRLGLTVLEHRIKGDASIFGQIYFADTDSDLYDEHTQKNITKSISAKTIIVDPKMYFLRNLGSVNNTIVHECIHWILHRKTFEFVRLFSKDVSHISCAVNGDAYALSKKATDMMEYQANQLAPRLQMPASVFALRARQYIGFFLKSYNTTYVHQVMEPVIEALAIDFAVSKQAAKVRLIDLGFDEAIGTLTFVDGHYVRPHNFKKGYLKRNQTFTISGQDAAVERYINQELRSITNDGDYLFVENHFVYNSPLYVEYSAHHKLQLTEYALSHMDECCIVFDLEIADSINQNSYTACFLNRENPDITFVPKYNNGFKNLPPETQIAMRKQQKQQEIKIRAQMTDDPRQCLELLLKWRGLKQNELAAYAEVNPKTITRMMKGESIPKLNNIVRICFALNLPPNMSEKLLEVCGCKLSPINAEHQWIQEALNVKYMDDIEDVIAYLADYGVLIN